MRKTGRILLVCGIVCLLAAILSMILVDSILTSYAFFSSILLNTAGITLLRHKK